MIVSFVALLDRADDKTDKVIERVAKAESPCQKYGSDSEQCEEAFSLAVLTITHPQACAIERKAGTLRAIRELADELDVEYTEPCAGARIAQERQRVTERSETRRGGSVAGGDSRTDSEHPSPTGGDVDNGAGRGGEDPDRGSDKGGSGGPSAPAGGGSDPAPAPPSGGPTREPDRPPATAPPPPVPTAPESRGFLPDTVEAAGKAVEQVGEGAGKAVEGVGETADCVLRGSC